MDPKTETTLILSTPECVQPGRAARVRSPPKAAATTAHITSVRPTLNANMRRTPRRPRRAPKAARAG